MSFRIKNNKKYHVDERVTLDTKHAEIVKSFDLNQAKKNKMISKMNRLNQQLKKINTDFEKNDYSLSNVLQKQKEKRRITTEIEKIQKDMDEERLENEKNTYYLDSLPYLRQYYDIDKHDLPTKNKVSKLQSTIEIKPPKVKKLESFFIKDHTETNAEKDNSTIFNEYKAVILNDFLSQFDNNYQNNRDLYIESVDDKGYRWCHTCDMEKTLIQNEGIAVCTNCGITEKAVIDNTKPSYKDTTQQELCCFSYKKMNHFNEWIYQSQGKEATHVPREVYDIILDEINKDHLREDQLTIERLRKYLKSHSLNKYYEHTQYIRAKILGQDPDPFTPELENKLRIMFKEVQTPFKKHKPQGRKNFLSYSYVFNKFLELLNEKKYMYKFPLPKSTNKLRNMDEVWKLIVEDLAEANPNSCWKFIPSTH